jgi:hypothetical protein
MIESTLLGGILGGVARFVPELLKFFDRKGERKHELAMLDKQIEVDKVRSAAAADATQAAQFTEALAALKSAYETQAIKSGNTMLDGIAILVRPTVTYVIFAMWVVVKLASLREFTTLNAWWGDADQAMLSAILNFWFLGRVFDKVK